MESNPATLAGAMRSAMRVGIGQAPQRTRWVDLAPRRPVYRVRRTSLCCTCDRPDQGVKHAYSNMGSYEPMLLSHFGNDQDERRLSRLCRPRMIWDLFNLRRVVNEQHVP